MNLIATNLPDPLDNAFLRHIMAITEISPELLNTLRTIHFRCPNNKIQRLVKDTIQACVFFSKSTYKFIPVDKNILKLTSLLYFLYDDIISPRNIDEKIQIWKVAYTIAYCQQNNQSPKFYIYEAIPLAKRQIVPVSKNELTQSLLHYADKIQNWIDMYFINSDDEAVLNIIVKLQLLSYMLTNSGEE